MKSGLRTTIILGAGGHGRVLADALRSVGQKIAVFLDSEQALWGKKIGGVSVAGGDEKLVDFPPSRHTVAVGVGAVRDTRRRRKLHEAAAAAGYELPAITAASAIVASSARLGAGAQILTRAVVHPGSEIGDGAVVNTAAVVEHDCSVGAHAFIGPAAVLCGGVRVGDGAFIGAGAIILPGVSIGAGALVAAGAVVLSEVPAGGKELGRGSRRGRRR